MRAPPQQRRLADGRLHLHDGPIDLIIEAFGETSAVEDAYAAAWGRFATILDELCAELPLLRADPLGAPGAAGRGRAPDGGGGRAIPSAALPHADGRGRRRRGRGGPRGDDDRATARPRLCQQWRRHRASPRAPAKRSQSAWSIARTGRACSAARRSAPRTACAASRRRAGEDAASRLASLTLSRSSRLPPRVADAAATLIANAVDLPGHPAIRRTPACDLDPQSDLGERRVTVAVGPLTADEIDRALAFGVAEAELWRELGLIEAAALRLGERTRLVGAAASRYLGRIPAVARNEEKARHAFG